MKLADDKEFDDMAKAVGAYVASMGGNAVVVGPVSIRAGSNKNKYSIEIEVLGKRPTKKNV